MTKPVVIEYPDGRQFGVRNAETAARVHPDAKVVGYQDGSEYEGSGESIEIPEGDPSEKWNRKQLDAFALSIGIEDPAKLGSKDDVLKAIESNRVSESTSTDSEDADTGGESVSGEATGSQE